jgi:hypothetical protein
VAASNRSSWGLWRCWGYPVLLVGLLGCATATLGQRRADADVPLVNSHNCPMPEVGVFTPWFPFHELQAREQLMRVPESLAQPIDNLRLQVFVWGAWVNPLGEPLMLRMLEPKRGEFRLLLQAKGGTDHEALESAQVMMKPAVASKLQDVWAGVLGRTRYPMERGTSTAAGDGAMFHFWQKGGRTGRTHLPRAGSMMFEFTELVRALVAQVVEQQLDYPELERKIEHLLQRIRANEPCEEPYRGESVTE